MKLDIFILVRAESSMFLPNYLRVANIIKFMTKPLSRKAELNIFPLIEAFDEQRLKMFKHVLSGFFKQHTFYFALLGPGGPFNILN